MSVGDAHYGLRRRVLSGRVTARTTPVGIGRQGDTDHRCGRSHLITILLMGATRSGAPPNESRVPLRRQPHEKACSAPPAPPPPPPSSFSAEARQCAERIDTRIILIDGTESAKLMIAHVAGVTPVAFYELKRVDSDFFAEE